MKKTTLCFAVIGTINYAGASRRVKGNITRPSLESAAKSIASILEYHEANDAEKHGPAKSFNLRLRPIAKPASKRRKKS
jgi:hypothetical protein